jgi:hypothetical protein
MATSTESAWTLGVRMATTSRWAARGRWRCLTPALTRPARALALGLIRALIVTAAAPGREARPRRVLAPAQTTGSAYELDGSKGASERLSADPATTLWLSAPRASAKWCDAMTNPAFR